MKESNIIFIGICFVDDDWHVCAASRDRRTAESSVKYQQEFDKEEGVDSKYWIYPLKINLKNHE